jgi:hypothetical protein
MNCDEFRERCHNLMDARKSELTDEQMVAHKGACQGCADFLSDLMSVDAGLRRLSLLPVPAPLLHSLRQIGQPQVLPSPGWRPDIERAAGYLIPGFILWGAQWVFPENVRPIFLAAMIFIGGFILVTSAVRPWVLGSPGR